MIIKESLPDSISSVFDSPEFGDEIGLTIKSIDYDMENMLLQFFIHYPDNSKKLWCLTSQQVVIERITRNWTTIIEIYKNHPMLLDYTDSSTELYFNGTIDKPYQLIVDINSSLNKLYEKEVNDNRFDLTPNHIIRLAEQRFGLFARGPKTILKIYAECLSKHNISAKLIGNHAPLPEKENLKLLKFGQSYIVAKSFKFEQIDV